MEPDVSTLVAPDELEWPLRCAPMSSTAELQARPLRRGEKIRLVDDIVGHPAGDGGKIAVANGFAWLRYWVRFADGTSVGHIDHSALVRTNDYDQFLASRELEAREAETRAESTSEVAGEVGDSDEAPATAGEGVVVNGVTIPQIFLDRAKAARARLAG